MGDNHYFIYQSLIISIIVIIISIILFEVGPVNHYTAMAQQLNKSMLTVGVHSPDFKFEKNHSNARTANESGVSHTISAGGMGENHTIMIVKLNTTKFQQIDKSQFTKAPEFAQIGGFIKKPKNTNYLSFF